MRKTSVGRRRSVSGSILEALEARLALSGTPLPSIGDLESPSNTVIRFETSFGDVDIEMFDSAAPVTVTNFVKYVTSGRLDKSFFHRRVTTPDTGIDILQGGGYYFEEEAGFYSEVEDDAPIIREQTGRSNLERTIAMARTQVLNSATSQFFFNTLDNVTLDTSGGGYAVFGRVIQGWSVIQTIDALRVLSLRDEAQFIGSGELFTTTPVTDNYNPASGVFESSLVYILNAEVIKPSGATGFYSQRVIFPEGHATPTSAEAIELSNPNSASATYQIIAHYETGQREVVLRSGTIAANTSLVIPLSANGGTTGLVRLNTPYSLEVQTSLPTSVTTSTPIAVSSTRSDFNAGAGESFFNPAFYTNDQLKTWDFPRIEKNDQSKEFLVWTNLTERTATITVTFYFENTTPVTQTMTLEGYRRGGLEIHTLTSLPDGVLAARVTSTEPIVAAMSDWDAPAAGVSPTGAYTPGWTVLGTPGGGSTAGAHANVDFRAGATNVLGILNPTTNFGVVTLTFFSASGGATQKIVLISAQRRQDLNLQDVAGLVSGERYSVKYSAGAAGLSMQYLSVSETNRGQQSTTRDDGVSSMFTSRAASAVLFSDLYVDPTQTAQIQRLRLFNPFANSGVTIDYTISLLFSDGTVIDLSPVTLASHNSVDVDLNAGQQVRDKAASGLAFRTFSAIVRGTANNTSAGTIQNAGFAQMVRFDPVTGRHLAENGINYDAGRDLATDGIFLPGSGGGTGG